MFTFDWNDLILILVIKFDEKFYDLPIVGIIAGI